LWPNVTQKRSQFARREPNQQACARVSKQSLIRNRAIILSWQFIHQYDPLRPKVEQNGAEDTIESLPWSLLEPPFCDYDPPFEEQAEQLPTATVGMAARAHRSKALCCACSAIFVLNADFITPTSAEPNRKVIDEGERPIESLCEATRRAGTLGTADQRSRPKVR
jgi:hypothetical protein